MTLRAAAVALVASLVSTIPAFAAPADPYEVAAYYFPGYHPHPRNDARLGRGWTEWELVKAAKPRFEGHVQPKVPAWGYEDESTPAAFEKKIAAASGNGVDVLLFDWYWHEKDGPFIERGLEEGFLKAPSRAKVKFALMWANHDWVDLFPAKAGVPHKLLYPGPVSRATFDQATDHVIKAYFSQPNHWTIDGKPYFSIYETMTLVKGLGGVEQTKEALDGFRARAKAAGFPGIHLNAVAWGLQPVAGVKDPNELVARLGVDSVTSYCWIHHNGPPGFPAASYETWTEQASQQWAAQKSKWKVPYHPNVSMGWDSSPRTTQTDAFKNIGYPYTGVGVGNTPAAFKSALARCKVFLDQDPAGPRILTVNAWNEWTEGSYLEPDTVNGMGYLKAIKDVFGQ